MAQLHEAMKTVNQFCKFYWDLNRVNISLGLPRWCSGKESACQSRRGKRHKFDPWVRKIPWSRKWQSTPIFLPQKHHSRGTWWATIQGVTKSQTDLATKQQLASPCLGYCSRENLISLHSSLSTTFQHLCSSLLRTLLASYSNIKDQLLWGTPWFYPGFPLSHCPPNPKYE